MAWTDVNDVTSRWVGDDTPSDTGLIETLIGDAERLILWEYPEINSRIFDPDESGDTPDFPLEADTVRQVVAQMVIRHLRNPEGARQATETEGPFSRNRTYYGDRPGRLWLDDDERRLLGYQPGSPTQSAFTVPQPTPIPGWLGGPGVW